MCLDLIFFSMMCIRCVIGVRFSHALRNLGEWSSSYGRKGYFKKCVVQSAHGNWNVLYFF